MATPQDYDVRHRLVTVINMLPEHREMALRTLTNLIYMGMVKLSGEAWFQLSERFEEWSFDHQLLYFHLLYIAGRKHDAAIMMEYLMAQFPLEVYHLRPLKDSLTLPHLDSPLDSLQLTWGRGNRHFWR